MDDKVPNQEPPKDTPAFKSQIVCRFPAGVKTTGLEVDLEQVDIVQIELAGHFLIRQAKKMYDQVDALNAQIPKGIVRAGAIPEGLKI